MKLHRLRPRHRRPVTRPSRIDLHLGDSAAYELASSTIMRLLDEHDGDVVMASAELYSVAYHAGVADMAAALIAADIPVYVHRDEEPAGA